MQKDTRVWKKPVVNKLIAETTLNAAEYKPISKKLVYRRRTNLSIQLRSHHTRAGKTNGYAYLIKFPV